MAVIALLTDFGTRDWYVGSMKGVVLDLEPRARLVDITHAIAPGDVSSGAFALASSLSSFPKGTVFLVVVDPGVGGSRRALAAAADDYWIVGPDNGVLSLVLCQARDASVHAIQNPSYMRHPVSSTFHGRDVFAPAAAHLVKGTPLSDFGPSVTEYVRLPWPEPKVGAHSVQGQVVYVDGFGNAITSIRASALSAVGFRPSQAKCGAAGSIPVCTFYQQVEAGSPLALIGSSGFLEISINMGSAQETLGLKVGDSVELL